MENLRKKIYETIKEISKPSRYIGSEIGSINKDWEKAKLKGVIAFPDLYEVGISNLGCRILYNIANKKEDFLLDRVYAPDIDFRDKLIEKNLNLYGLESFKPLKDFDVVAFSLQYELCYPTILKMLELGGVSIRRFNRDESEPIILAGGPCCYNPNPMLDFIDCFLIGDGEELFIESLETIKNSKEQGKTRKEILKELSNLEGAYVPDFSEKVKRQTSELKKENTPTIFPVPYSSSVHDRAVVEIRRGCGRMCRFCQSCFVNLPIRERNAKEAFELVNESLENTGYEEYSLLSLSTSDYTNIENLVCSLNSKHRHSGASISFPSQRADKFNLKLAEEVSSVRKSTITFAPEAGSQRLRDAINKNLKEEEILNALQSVYEAGWNRAKLYFMIGLPAETQEDLDGIIDLLKKAKDNAFRIKREKNLNRHFDMTCTISIFVPKPFTPFQWFGQNKKEDIIEKIKYLRIKIKEVRGVNLKFHNTNMSVLEACLCRGGKNLSNLIERAYLNGCYLDAWDEYFDLSAWEKSAKEANITIESIAEKDFAIEELLPWDFIDTGVRKDWLIGEYKKAFESVLGNCCENQCVNCGVCDNQRKTIRSNEIIEIQTTEKREEVIEKSSQDNHKYRLKIQKKDHLKYISHLDWQGYLYKVARKAGLKLAFTEGFNPSPKISFALALSVFVESECEYVDIELKEKIDEEELKEKLNKHLREESMILKVKKLSSEDLKPAKLIKFASYKAKTNYKITDMETIAKNFCLSENVTVEEISSKGLKRQINLKDFVYSLNTNGTELEFILKVNPDKNLRADKFLEHLTGIKNWEILRTGLLDGNLKELI